MNRAGHGGAMSFRGRLLVSASVLALGFADLPGAFAQSAPSTEPQPQQLPAVNVQKAAQRRRKPRSRKPPPKAPRVPTQTAGAPSIPLPEILNIAAPRARPIRTIRRARWSSRLTGSSQQPYARPGEYLEVDARPDRHPAFRRGQSQPVLPARLQSRPRHRSRHLGRRHAGEHAHPRPWPGLCRHELPDPGAHPVDAHPQGSVLRRRGRFLVCRRAAHRLLRHDQSRHAGREPSACSATAAGSGSSRCRLQTAISSSPAKASSTTARGTFPTG